MSSLRATVQRRSGPVLVLLSHSPKAVPPLVAAALLLCGLFLPPAAGLPLLLVLLLVLAWLAYLSWPVLAPPARVLRVAVLVLLAVLGATRLR